MVVKVLADGTKVDTGFLRHGGSAGTKEGGTVSVGKDSKVSYIPSSSGNSSSFQTPSEKKQSSPIFSTEEPKQSIDPTIQPKKKSVVRVNDSTPIFGSGQPTSRLDGSYILSSGQITRDLNKARKDAASTQKTQQTIVKKQTQSFSNTGYLREAPKQSRIKRFVGGFVSGFTERRGALQSTRTDQRLTISQAGIGAGAITASAIPLLGKSKRLASVGKRVGGIFSSTTQKAVSKTKPLISKSKQVSQDLFTKINKNQYSKFIKDLGLTSAKGSLIAEGTKKTSQVTAPKDQRQIMQDKGFKKAMKEGFAAEKQALSEAAWYKGLGYEISPFISDKKGVYQERVKQQLISQGYTGKQLESGVKAAMRQRTASGIGEASALLEISRSSEKIGRAGVSKAFEKAQKKNVQVANTRIFGEMFKRTSPSIAKAGFIEGASQELSQEFSREQSIDPLKVGGMGVFGAASAGLIGGTIAGLKPKRPSASKIIEVGAYVTDPFEKPGDLLADLGENIVKRRTGKSPKIPILTQSINKDDLIGFRVSTPTQTTNTKSKKRTPIKTPTIRAVNTPTPTDIFGFGSNTPTPVPTPIKTPVNIPVKTNTNIPSPMNIFSPINSQTKVNTNTPTPTSIFTSIPTITPVMKFPPPFIPPGMDLGSGLGKGAGRRKGRGYANELEQGLKLFNNMLGGRK